MSSEDAPPSDQRVQKCAVRLIMFNSLCLPSHECQSVSRPLKEKRKSDNRRRVWAGSGSMETCSSLCSEGFCLDQLLLKTSSVQAAQKRSGVIFYWSRSHLIIRLASCSDFIWSVKVDESDLAAPPLLLSQGWWGSSIVWGRGALQYAPSKALMKDQPHRLERWRTASAVFHCVALKPAPLWLCRSSCLSFY